MDASADARAEEVRPLASDVYMWASAGHPDSHASLRMEVIECPRCVLPVFADRRSSHLAWHNALDGQLQVLEDALRAVLGKKSS